jgi:hypothetical protein
MKPINPAKKIYVYRNLQKQKLSLMQSNVVVGHAEAVILTDVEFRVRQSGRERVLRERQKNVHAFTIGLLEQAFETPYAWVLEVAPIFDRENARSVTYNPYKFTTFVDQTSEAPVYSGRRVLVTANKGIFVENES